MTEKNTQFNDNIREDWTPERAALCIPENMLVLVTPIIRLRARELARLQPKLELVVQIAARLAANMLKGTLKYKRDNWTVSEWLQYLEDDASGTLNYIALFGAAYQREKT